MLPTLQKQPTPKHHAEVWPHPYPPPTAAFDPDPQAITAGHLSPGWSDEPASAAAGLCVRVQPQSCHQIIIWSLTPFSLWTGGNMQNLQDKDFL